MPTLREYEEAFEADPTQMPAFLALRKVYRERRKFDKLVTLYETRAQVLDEDAKAADLFYLAAEVRFDHLEDPEGAEVDLRHALSRYAGHVKAAERLKLMFRDQGRTRDYMTMMEVEASGVVQSGDAQRRAHLQQEMAQLYANLLAPIERGAQGPQRGRVASEDELAMIESARKIYRALTDWPNVVRLYELELALVSEPKRRCDLMLAHGKVLAERMGRLEEAAALFGEVVRLAPREEKPIELLAGVYARPEWPGADGAEQAATLYHQIARRRHEAGDVEGAVALLRKALALRPAHAAAGQLIERILYEARRLRELDRYYRERVAAAADAETRMDFLWKRAQLAERDLQDPAEALVVYEELLALEPAGGPAAQRLAEIYAGRGHYAKLADLRERQLEVLAEPDLRLPLLRELAVLYRDRLGDPEQAAVYLHAILQIDPGDEEAQEAYADHFRRKGEWGALVDLMEFSFEHARSGAAPRERLIQRAEEIAVLAERQLGEPARALAAWRRLEELAPEHERAREAQKRILLKDKNWAGLAEVLEREANAAPDAERRRDVQRRLAKLYLEKLGDRARGADWLRKTLADDPADAAAFRALVEIHEQEGDWASLCDVLRAQLDVAPRGEKVALLRRLGAVYLERLAAPLEAAWAAREVLALQPGDVESFERLESILERTQDWAGLAEVLAAHLEHADGPAHVDLARRLARLRGDILADRAAAAEVWERVLDLEPGDAEALQALALAYGELGRPADLARVYELQLQRAYDDPGRRVEVLRQLGALAAGALGDPGRAIATFEQLLREQPGDPEALETLTALYREAGRWAALQENLAERIARAGDPAQAVPLALERAEILERRLRSPGQAVEVLEQIVGELDPRCSDAFERLRRIATAEADWARLVSVCERQMYLEQAPDGRLRLAMELGVLQRDRLGDPVRAVQAFERALAMAPDNAEILHALAGLYDGIGEPEKLVATQQKLLSLTTDPGARADLMRALGETCERALGDPRRAFEWARRAHAEAPGAETLARLQGLAAAHGLWEELLRVYDGERARAVAGDLPAQLALFARMVEICEVRLQDPGRAFVTLREALTLEPTGAEVLPELERLAEAAGQWSALLDVYARIARARPALDERIELLRRRAGVREQRLQDPSGAMDEWLRAFALDPGRDDVRAEIERLAEQSGRWEDALKVEGQIFARAADIDDKVRVAKRAAAMVEERVKDAVRAFHAYLNAFRLAPEDPEILGHLWRLARALGTYRKSDGAGQVGGASAAGAALRAVRELGRSSADPDATMHLDLEEGTGAPSAPSEATVALELDEVEELEDLEELEATPAPIAGPPPVPGSAVGPPPPPGAARAAGAAAFGSAWEEFAHAYALLPANDNPTRRRHLLRQAEIWERGALDVGRTLAALERAFRLDPTDPEIDTELQRVGEVHGVWDRVCEIYLAGIGASLSAEDAVRLHHRVAQVRERLGQRDLAEERYRAIVELDRDHRAALDRLEEIYREDARWAELASLLERRVSSSLSRGSDPATRARAIELADLYERHLDRPYEAIDTLERYLAQVDDEVRAGDQPELEAELRGVLERLARLYGRIDLWGKAVETMRRERELTSAPERRRALGLAIARTLAQELATPPRAVEAYQAVLADAPGDPEALAALDRLLESLGRYEELAALLERRIAEAPPAERVALVKRRARILEERLDNPDAAAANLRALGGEALEDDDVAATLLRNLRRAGLFHEATTLIGQRIERLRARGAPASRIADCHVELGRLRLEDLNDIDGARAAFEETLRVEERADALNLLAQTYLARNEFRDFAEVRERQARLAEQPRSGAAALVEAGEVYRDQLRDTAQARRCFEAALRLAPEDTAAVRALVSLLLGEGREDEARRLLSEQLELVHEPATRALLLTDLARASWQAPGDLERLQPLLDEATELAPDYVPALVTLADLYYKERAWEQAERRLTQALRRLRGSPSETATLVHRLGEVYEKLGRLEDGYRALQEADRKHPDQLLIKVALCSNRYQARRWREAAAQVDRLAEHPDAARYPEETARALALGGDACSRSKQADRARELFQAALRLSPQQPQALAAMADAVLADGDWVRALDYLQKLADATHDRAGKSRLLQRIGDLHREHGRKEDARAHYEAAVALLDEPSADDVPLLERTLELQQEAGAVAEATETSTRLIARITEPAVRARKRREAAAILLAHGQLARAAELLGQAIEDDARDERALTMLVEVHERLGKPEASLFVLERVLPSLPAPGSKAGARAQRAALWEKLGELRRASDLSSAASALEKAVEIDPDRVGARVLLGELYEGERGSDGAALANHRALAMADLTRDESVRALARAFAKEGDVDAARCAYALLEVLGLAKKGDRAFLGKHPLPVMRPDEPYPAVLSEEARRRWLCHPEAHALAEIFGTLWESGLPFEGPTLESLHVKSEDRISPMSEQDVARILTEVGKALDNKRPGFFTGWDPAVRGVQLALAHPPGIVISSALIESASHAELRFRLARALELARPEHILSAAVPPRALARLFGNVLKAFHPRHARRRAGSEAAGAEAARLKKELPYKVAKRLAELFAELGSTPFSSARWREQVDDTANRAGLLMCGDLGVAARIVLADTLDMPVAEVDAAMLCDHAREPGPLRELLRFALSEGYSRLRAELGLSITRAAA